MNPLFFPILRRNFRFTNAFEQYKCDEMKRNITTLFAVFFALMSVSQEDMNYFLPEDVSYNEQVPTPEQFFGQKVGEWHLTHDQILSYMKEIDRVSGRAIIQEYARTYENRPLIHVIFTSEENQLKLDELKALHIQHADPNENIPDSDVPLVVTLGYSIHGNESRIFSLGSACWI